MVRPYFEPIEMDKKFLATIEALKQLDKDSDRALGITCAAFLDEALADCLNKHFLQSSSDLRERVEMLLKPGQALNAFATRIDVGWVLGIYGKAARSDMARIRDIRNLFAHKVEIYSFTDPEIAKHCDQLKFAQKYWTKTDYGWEFKLQLDDGSFIQFSTHSEADYPFSKDGRHRYRYTCALLTQLLTRIPARVHTPLF
jgi:DNA-binding MltR family transcriptional regulator